MTEELKSLIEKIQQEGVEAGEKKAKQIEEEARQRASDLVEKAKKEAQKISDDAEAKAAKTQESTRLDLEQASRDLILTLKKEIQTMLDRLIATSVRQALSPEELAKILQALVRERKGEAEPTLVSLNKDDLEKLEKGLMAELKNELKKGIVLKPAADILGGLTISFDAGKSIFDLTDKALAEYIGSYLKPRLKDLLDEASAGKP